MIRALNTLVRISGLGVGIGCGVICRALVIAACLLASGHNQAVQGQVSGEKSWEIPGRISIYDLQFGPATPANKKWRFLGNIRTFNAGLYGDRLTLMVRFSYDSSRSDIPLKFVIKLPDARQYEKTVHLRNTKGKYSYKFTIHHPDEFLGSGSIYLYYGFSIVDVLDFTIVPGA